MHHLVKGNPTYSVPYFIWIGTIRDQHRPFWTLFIFTGRDDQRQPLPWVPLFNQSDRFYPTTFNHTGIGATTTTIWPATAMVTRPTTRCGATMHSTGKLN
jgi:hypothetical protein